MIITTHAGDRLDLSDHIHQLARLGEEDFRSAENEAFIYRLGQCISLAAGANAPHAVLVRLRDQMTPELWSHVGFVWAEAAERPYVDQDGNPTYRQHSAAECDSPHNIFDRSRLPC
ncbi:hypothetical protein JL101_036185 (plasmid) [Skermanella rosea]|uniref:hypothetical protein n=1 Tax=Skermanella rosea TaxID=1817965 RepID=UPI0019331A5F|nr:hypothetical protein [Skermanella rosea]UEM08195.1 hypothetical protein JL101_036185 [Skermanella rosea]